MMKGNLIVEGLLFPEANGRCKYYYYKIVKKLSEQIHMYLCSYKQATNTNMNKAASCEAVQIENFQN